MALEMRSDDRATNSKLSSGSCVQPTSGPHKVIPGPDMEVGREFCIEKNDSAKRNRVSASDNPKLQR